ncbi:MAG TPA: beta-propeller fold lactonase family protein, partial [Jatrophihabitans sp.]|nr:beta-propeller fold lactonase family protein [Jatrophihabitans sp.]
TPEYKSTHQGESSDAKSGVEAVAAHTEAATPRNVTVPAPRTNNGYLWVMSNQETGNSITVFARDYEGNLTRKGTYITGGLGAGNSYDLEASSDPLVSQGSLGISDDQRFLFACNAGSDEVSVLRIDGDTLTLVDRVPSGGIRPVSLTSRGSLLYAVNAGGLPPNTPPAPEATIAGWVVGEDGRLTAIDGSNKSLLGGPAAGPSQIQFSPDGRFLVVTERQTSIIDVFPIDCNGAPGEPVKNISAGPGPFTATFTGDTLLVTEVVGVAFTYGSLSSYKLNDDGTLRTISASVNTTERTSCWTVNSIIDPNVTYVANNQSGSISAVRFDAEGAITPFPEDGHLTTNREDHLAQDLAISSDGRFLYCLIGGYDEKLADPRLPTYVPGTPYGNRMSIGAWRIEPNGSLTPLKGYAVVDDPPTLVNVGQLALQDGLVPGSEGMVAI